jgi:hypothetical protein
MEKTIVKRLPCPAGKNDRMCVQENYFIQKKG